MNWTLFSVSCGVWIFFGFHFIFAGRLKQMAEAGLPVEVDGNAMLVASKAISQLAILNIIAFSVAYGIYVSWWQAAAILVGGYVVSLLFMFVTRGPAYDSLLNPMHKLGWLALPAFSVALWVIAF